jgi:hypothetical protein
MGRRAWINDAETESAAHLRRRDEHFGWPAGRRGSARGVDTDRDDRSQPACCQSSALNAIILIDDALNQPLPRWTGRRVVLMRDLQGIPKKQTTRRAD